MQRDNNKKIDDFESENKISQVGKKAEDSIASDLRFIFTILHLRCRQQPLLVLGKWRLRLRMGVSRVGRPSRRVSV
jgi:hypothetical protein